MHSLHRLARRMSIEVSDLQDERILLLRQGFGTREMFDGACRIAHVHTRIVLEAGDPHSLIALAQAAQGIAIVPSTVWFSDRTIRVVPILHARESLGMWGWVVWDPKRFLPAFTKGFVDGPPELGSTWRPSAGSRRTWAERESSGSCRSASSEPGLARGR
jgi:DNA-binding transcriptional LysR family regulator